MLPVRTGRFSWLQGTPTALVAKIYNYELGKKRADAVSRYLITKKSLDPMKVIPISYGQSAPVAENTNNQGRSKNRRVEILVYREGITSQAAEAPAPQQPAAPRSSQATQPDGERVTQR